MQLRPLVMTLVFLSGVFHSEFIQAAENSQQNEFLNSPAHQDREKLELGKLIPHFFPGCTDFKNTDTKVTVFIPLTFGSDGKLTAGYWKEQHAIAGCGIAKLLNINWLVDNTGEVRAAAGLNGSTIADILLQKDAMQYAFMGAARKVSCKQFLVTDTRFDGNLPVPAQSTPKAPVVKQVWHETWVVSGCGRVMAVPIKFIEAENGTSILPDYERVIEERP